MRDTASSQNGQPYTSHSDTFFFLPWCKKKKGRKRRRRDRRGRKEEGTRRSGGSSWSVEDNPKKDYPPRFEAAPTDPRRISRLKHQTPRGKKGRRRSKQTRPGRQEGERKKKEEKHHIRTTFWRRRIAIPTLQASSSMTRQSTTIRQPALYYGDPFKGPI